MLVLITMRLDVQNKCLPRGVKFFFLLPSCARSKHEWISILELLSALTFICCSLSLADVSPVYERPYRDTRATFLITLQHHEMVKFTDTLTSCYLALSRGHTPSFCVKTL